jgi:hypothetical protein
MQAFWNRKLFLLVGASLIILADGLTGLVRDNGILPDPMYG